MSEELVELTEHDLLEEVIARISTMNLILLRKLGGRVQISREEWEDIDGKYLIESFRDSASNIVINLISRGSQHVNH